VIAFAIDKRLLSISANCVTDKGILFVSANIAIDEGIRSVSSYGHMGCDVSFLELIP
jgi:hypothetical protein